MRDPRRHQQTCHTKERRTNCARRHAPQLQDLAPRTRLPERRRLATATSLRESVSDRGLTQWPPPSPCELLFSSHEVTHNLLITSVIRRFSARTKLHEENLLTTNGLQQVSVSGGVTPAWVLLGST